MIHEFAVDPEAVASWQNYRYVTEKFGVSQGRLISRFPKKWIEMVKLACRDCPDVEKKKIMTDIERIGGKLYNAGRSFDKDADWITNAATSHRQQPFHAIITTADHASSTDRLNVDSLSNDDAAWTAPRGGVVSRTASDMAAAAEMLLRCAAEIVFVDPYFGGEVRFGKPLAAMIQRACGGDRIPRRLEYHLSAKSIPSDEFCRQVEKQCPYLRIPPAVKLVFVRWNQLDDQDSLHPRYILTERGGLRFDHGLDEGDPGKTTDVECIDPSIHAHRWEQFRGGSSHFELFDAWIVTSDTVTKAVWDGRGFIPQQGGMK